LAGRVMRHLLAPPKQAQVAHSTTVAVSVWD